MAISYFRRISRIKYSETNDYFSKLKKNGAAVIFLAAVLTSITTFMIFYNTYPDSIAVYNPFEKEVGIRGVSYVLTFCLFAMAFLVVLVLILNSFYFTGPNSIPAKSMQESSKICFTLNVIKSDYWACYSTVMPTVILFTVVTLAYTLANVFGTSVL